MMDLTLLQKIGVIILVMLFLIILFDSYRAFSQLSKELS